MSKKIKIMSLLLGASVIAAPQAIATDGYFQYGIGARHSALGGAGLANVTDASGVVLNPAGIATLGGSELSVGLAIFSPRRKYTGGGQPGFTPVGEVASNSNYFPVPNVSYVRSIDDTSSWALSMYGNGGMNTNYPAVDRAMMECGGGSGLFCGGEAGVDLMQAFVGLTYAKKMGMISFGVSPLLVVQRFEAKGLGAFAAGGFSSDPANMTDNGHDLSTGIGIKLGVSADLSDNIRIGGTFQPKISMSEFDDYAGLFADAGKFDIPPTFAVGAAMDLSDELTVMVDYSKIYYSKVPSIGNSSGIMLPFGAVGGPGFGWSDVSTFKIGAEWKQSDKLTLRAGFSRNTNPISPQDVNLNVLAPGTVRSHFTGGFKLGLENNSAFEFAAAYVPTESVSGIGMMNPNHTVKVEMKQYILSFGWNKKF